MPAAGLIDVEKEKTRLAGEVANAFLAAARACSDGGGSDTYNLPTQLCSVEDVVQAIKETVHDAEITFAEASLPFPAAYDASALTRRLGVVSLIPMGEGVRQTIAAFTAAMSAGRLDPERLLG